MRVRDIMNTSVKTARPESRVRDVAILMCFNKISGVPVVDGNHRLVGMISEKDILFGMYPKMDEVTQCERYENLEQLEDEYTDVLNLKVADLMTDKVFTVSPDVPILRATSVMFVHKIRRIPVIEGDKLVGIVSIGDVHKAVFKEAFDRQFQGTWEQATQEHRHIATRL